jgi:hypothetical protein
MLAPFSLACFRVRGGKTLRRDQVVTALLSPQWLALGESRHPKTLVRPGMSTIAFYDPKTALRIWTVFSGAKDVASPFCARLSLVTEKGVVLTGDLIEADSIEALRLKFESEGLIAMPRDPNDDPVIVEVWL